MSFENISVEKFSQLMQEENHVILDVRSPQELAEGAVPGHTMINFFDGDFHDQIEKIDKSKDYLVYCRSGNRSGQACAMMSSMGFEGKLYNLEGGIGAWKAAQN
ncbi:MAG: rhodanese-like domain-containing protein [Ekhidna sp.]